MIEQLLRAVGALADIIAKDEDEDPSWGYLTCEEVEALADALIAITRIDEADKVIAAHVGLGDATEFETDAHAAFFERIA